MGRSWNIHFWRPYLILRCYSRNYIYIYIYIFFNTLDIKNNPVMEIGDFNTPSLTGNGVCPWITATLIIKLWDLPVTPPRVFSNLMLSTAVICHIVFANSTSFHITYPEYDVHPWCTSPSGLWCYWPGEVWGVFMPEIYLSWLQPFYTCNILSTYDWCEQSVAETGFSPSTSVSPCPYNSTSAPYSFHLSATEAVWY